MEIAGVIMMESIYPTLVNAKDASIDPSDVTFTNSLNYSTRTRILDSLKQGHEAFKSHLIRSGSELTPSVLIRAEEPWPSLKGKFEMPTMLGWNEDGLDIVQQVSSTPGHHYSIFEETNVRRPLDA